MELSAAQMNLVEAGLDSSSGLTGPAGSGKTTVGLERLKYLAQQGVPGREILVFFPQRNLGVPYQEQIHSHIFPGSSLPATATFGGLARRNLELFWPLVLDKLNLFSASTPPIFLTLESTLYFLSRLIEPLITDQGLFSAVAIQRNRLYSQILDNLNKAAVHGFPSTEISRKLKTTWIGDPVQERIFDDAQHSANLFREYCLQNNLLDFSLQIETFSSLLAKVPLVRETLLDQFKHLIYDNAEEDIPVAHDFIGSILPSLTSALIITDQDAGFRHFLGASPDSAARLLTSCSETHEFSEILTTPVELQIFNDHLRAAILSNSSAAGSQPENLSAIVSINYQPFLPQMASWVADRIKNLLEEGVSPAEIVILAPYLSDSLRFILASELHSQGISTTSHRPSRALRDEPATHCLLTLSILAHPEWGIQPTLHELSQCFLQAFSNLDLTRANILARQVSMDFKKDHSLKDFENIAVDLQERITFAVGSKYQLLRNWIMDYRAGDQLALDHFLIKIFGELVTQPGFGFQADFNKAKVTERVVDSIQKFRQSAGSVLGFNHLELGLEYVSMVRKGLLANQYLQSWIQRPDDAVYLTPAYTFLLSNYCVDYQFWLDVGSSGWYERIYQPLTNPHVLQRDWEPGKPWRDAEEHAQNLHNLANLSTGLMRRCKKGVYFCLTDTDEKGFEQKGLLIQALNRVFRMMTRQSGPG